MPCRLPLAGGPSGAPRCLSLLFRYLDKPANLLSRGPLLRRCRPSASSQAPAEWQEQFTPSASLPSVQLLSGGLTIILARCSGMILEDRRLERILRSVHVAAVTPEAAAAGSTVASVAALLPVDAARGQQQALHSLLQEIESYSSSSSKTKLSLKVYHLQQLAAVPGASYLLLQQHPGVACLVRDLTAAAAAAPEAAAAAGQELSPPQLHALALCCCKLKLPANHPLWNALAKQMLRHCKHVLRDVGRLNEHDVACLLFTQQIQILSDENSEGPPQGAPGGPPAAGLGQAATLRTTSNKQLKGSSKRKSNGSKNSSRSSSSSSRLSKLSLKVVRVCAWVLQQRAAAVSPKSLVCCLYEFGLLQLLPWRLLLLLRRRLRQQQQLQQLDDRGLALLALSLALLQQREPKIVKRIGTVLQQRQQQPYLHLRNTRQEQQLLVTNQSLCLLLHAIAQLNIREQLVLEAACQRIETAASTFTNLQLGMCSHALGRLGVQHLGVWRSINTIVNVRTPILSLLLCLLLPLLLLLLPLCRCNCCHLCFPAYFLLQQRASQLSPLDLALCLLGASKAGAADPDAVGALVAQALKLQRGFTGQQLANLLDGLALSGCIKEGELTKSDKRKTLFLLGGFKAGGPDTVGPYKVDARLSAKDVDAALQRLLLQEEPDSSSSGSKSKSKSISADVCLDLLSEGCYCPLSGSMLGAARLKQRQLQQLGFLYCSIRRQQWLRASAEVQQQMLLRALLVATGLEDKAE
ncbi:hypothetical protein Emag_002779 [Eimeria magna]